MEKGLINLDGIVDTGSNPVTIDEFVNKFIDWVESNNWSFAGGCEPYIAKSIGEAVAKTFIDDWNNHGTEWFPKGIQSLPGLAYRIAKIQLPLSSSRKVSEKQCELCAETAMNIVAEHFQLKGEK